MSQDCIYTAHLPANPKIWTPSQVALYLTFVLGLTPLPIVQDVTAYVRSARMGGKQFLRLREKDLAEEGLNLKWRKLMMEGIWISADVAMGIGRRSARLCAN